MSLNLFDVDAEMIRKDYRAMTSPFSLDSIPSLETVERWIDQKAAQLAGLLQQQSIAAESITEDAYNVAWLWCQETVCLMVALRSGWPNDVAKELKDDWQEELDARLKALADKGGTALGITPTDSGDLVNGVTSHISALGLETGESDAAPDITPRFRRNTPR